MLCQREWCVFPFASLPIRFNPASRAYLDPGGSMTPASHDASRSETTVLAEGASRSVGERVGAESDSSLVVATLVAGSPSGVA